MHVLEVYVHAFSMYRWHTQYKCAQHSQLTRVGHIYFLYPKKNKKYAHLTDDKYCVQEFLIIEYNVYTVISINRNLAVQHSV